MRDLAILAATYSWVGLWTLAMVKIGDLSKARKDEGCE